MVGPAHGSTVDGKVAHLSAREVVAAVAAVVVVYSSALLTLHHYAAVPASEVDLVDKPGYWGTLPSAWDHPEPNYVVSGVIGEFWSVLTTIPVAGALLLYEGLRFHYGGKVLLIYLLTCCMYSLAFMAHLTLQKLVFSTTVVAVMSNALLTFAMFSQVVHGFLHSKLARGAIVLCAECALVGTVVRLPYILNHGGVWTLFVVQSPGVFLATALAATMEKRSSRPQEQQTYSLVRLSGSLLSMAMVLSLVECLVGFDYGYIKSLWSFPWLHIAIHVFEQVGIYHFGVGVASLQALLQPTGFGGSELRHVNSLGMVYLYCPCNALAGPAPELVKPMAARPESQAEPLPAKSARQRTESPGPRKPKPGEASRPPASSLDVRTEPAAPVQTAQSQVPAAERKKRIESPGVRGRSAHPK